VSGPNLTLGKSTSCGCARVEKARSLTVNRQPMVGELNPSAQRAKSINGHSYVPSDSVWYKRAAGIFYAARKRGVALGFSTAMELAAYVQAIASDRCPVFGQVFVTRGSGFSKWSPSIDKIDPALGYVPGNIQIISMMANCMKRDATPDELLAFADWVIKEVRK